MMANLVLGAMTSEIVRDGLLPSFKFSYTQEMIIRTVKGGYRLHYVDIPFIQETMARVGCFPTH